MSAIFITTIISIESLDWFLSSVAFLPPTPPFPLHTQTQAHWKVKTINFRNIKKLSDTMILYQCTQNSDIMLGRGDMFGTNRGVSLDQLLPFTPMGLQCKIFKK